MKCRNLCAVVLAVLGIFAVTGVGTRNDRLPAFRPAVSNPAGVHRPMSFIPNLGQADSEALFYAKTPGRTVWLTRDALVIDCGYQGRGEPLRLRYLGVEGSCRALPEKRLPQAVHYFVGDDPSCWRTNVGTYEAVYYSGLYRGIDLKVYGSGDAVEYDWIVSPGGDPRSIRFKWEHGAKADLDERGDLLVETERGRVVQRRPAAYQAADGRTSPVEAEYRSWGDGVFGVDVGDYDRSKPLVIDPLVLLHSTYGGGASWEFLEGMTVDAEGCVIVVGNTKSVDFPTKNALDSSLGGDTDAFVSKFSRDGQTLIFSTYLGGARFDSGNAVVVDEKGNIYLTGQTRSPNFPLKNPYQASLKGGTDAFLAKLSSSGTALLFSTYLGGSGIDYGRSLWLGKKSQAYVAGLTRSSRDFPLKNALDTSFNGYTDIFLTRFSASGSSLLYSTLLGGSSADEVDRIVVDGDGAMYLTGLTYSTNFPVTANAFDTGHNGGGPDAFVSKLNPAGSQLVFSSYLGGQSEDKGHGLAVDAAKCVYLTGVTRSSNFPTKNALDNVRVSSEAFVVKLDATGHALVYSTFLGGSGADTGFDIAVDKRRQAYVVGHTSSTDLPLRLPYDGALGGWMDAFVAGIDATGTQLVFSSYLGGSGTDEGLEIELGLEGELVVGGSTDSGDFPAVKPWDGDWNGDWDFFLATMLMKIPPGPVPAADRRR